MSNIWDQIYNDLIIRSKKFNNLFSHESIPPKEGVVAQKDLIIINKIKEDKYDNKEKDYFYKYWFWVYIPMLEELLKYSCWIALGYFEYTFNKQNNHWLYFTDDKNVAKVLNTFSLIGNNVLFDEFIKNQFDELIAYKLYSLIIEKNPEITHGIPMCLKLHNDIDLPTHWNGKNAIIIDLSNEWKIISGNQRDNILSELPNQNKTNLIYNFHGIDNKNIYSNYFNQIKDLTSTIEDKNGLLNKLPIKDIQKKILKYLYLIRDSSDNDPGALLLIPDLIPTKELRVIRGVALLICFKHDNLPLLKDIISSSVIANQLTSTSLSLNALALSAQDIKFYALKSAIAAIMSRNFSHNIGSHVIANVTSKINSLNIQDNYNLFKYIQQRNDFIAQITTEFPQWSSPAWFTKEIMRWFYFQKHLLNFICRAEGLKAHVFRDDIDKNEELYIITKQIIKRKGKNGEVETIINTIDCTYNGIGKKKNALPVIMVTKENNAIFLMMF